MTDTPRSEGYQLRFANPVDELDDHRRHPEHLPRADTTGSSHRPGSRRGTTGSTAPGDRPDLLHVSNALRDGFISRDFEQAIIDDDRSERASTVGNDATNKSEPPSPQVARKSTFSRPQQYLEAIQGRSRASSKSSRTESPPNSVDAFAEVRPHLRVGALNSPAPSPCEDNSRPRADSYESRSRRYNFSENKPNERNEDESSSEGSVEDDVCFPEPEEPQRLYTIDFDELHEFVDSQKERTPIPETLRRTCSFSCQSKKPQVFPSLAQKRRDQAVPIVVNDIPTIIADDHMASEGIGESCSDVDIKDAEKLDKRCTAELCEKKAPVQRWSFFSSEQDESVHATDLGDLLLPGQTFFDLFALGPEDGVWWLDMLCPTEEEVEVICKAFGVHRLTREDILEQETREKVELFKSYYFVCFRSFVCDAASDDYLEPVNVYAVVFQEGILTFSFSPSPHAPNVRKRMGKLRDYASLGSNWICYALIDDIVDLFGPAIHGIENETDAIEDDVFTVRPEDSRILLRKISHCRKKVMSLIRLLGGKADVIKGFAKRCNENYAIAPRQDIGMYLSDVQDHVVTMTGSLGHFEKMLSRSHSNYLAQISVDGIAQGNRVNKVLGKVTLIATILVPMNLVCGLFGMNVNVPGKADGGLAWFFGIVGTLFVFALAAIVVAKRCRWV